MQNVDTTSIATFATAGTFTAKQTFQGGIAASPSIVSVANAAGSVQDIASFDWDPGDGGQMTDADSGVAITFKMPDSSDNQDIFGRIAVHSEDDTAGSEDGSFAWSLMKAGTVTEVMTLTPTALTPSVTDVVALGTGALNWSDLFLDSGAVINFDNGDVTLTHAANTITMAGG